MFKSSQTEAVSTRQSFYTTSWLDFKAGVSGLFGSCPVPLTAEQPSHGLLGPGAWAAGEGTENGAGPELPCVERTPDSLLVGSTAFGAWSEINALKSPNRGREQLQVLL